MSHSRDLSICTINRFEMKIVVLLSVTAFMATGAVGLECYHSDDPNGTNTTKKECPTWADACITTSLGDVGKTRGCGRKGQAKDCDEEFGVCACTSPLCNGVISTSTTSPTQTTPGKPIKAAAAAATTPTIKIKTTPGNTHTGNTGTGNTGTGKAGNSGKKEMAPLMIIMGATILSILY